MKRFLEMLAFSFFVFSAGCASTSDTGASTQKSEEALMTASQANVASAAAQRTADQAIMAAKEAQRVSAQALMAAKAAQASANKANERVDRAFKKSMQK